MMNVEGSYTTGENEITTLYSGFIFVKPYGSGNISIYAYNPYEVQSIMIRSDSTVAHGSGMNKIKITATTAGNYFILGINLKYD